MIRFCDKEVWTIQEGQWSRLEMLSFFIRGHITDIIQLVDVEGEHIGVTTYRKVLHNHEGIPVCDKVFKIDGQFWVDAANYFDDNPEEMVPVMDQIQNIIGFCYNDGRRYSEFEEALLSFERADKISIPLHQMFPKIQQVCIMDINEYSIRLYQILEKLNVPVCVLGEKWEWFGVEPYINYSNYPDYAKLYIYSEGTNLMRGEMEHMYPAFMDLRSVDGFWAIADWASVQTKYIIEEQAKRISDLGVNVCKVIIPVKEQIRYFTELEEETIKHDLFLGKYIDEEIESVEIRELYWKVWGEECCEIFKKLGDTVFPWEIALNGLRIVYYSHAYGKPTIWLIGPCVVEGYGLCREQTMPAFLQRFVGDKYNVVSVGAEVRYFHEWKEVSEMLCLHKHDIVIYVNSSSGFVTEPEGTVIDLTDEYNVAGRNTYFASIPIHANADGAEMIARVIHMTYIIKKITEAEQRPGSSITSGECIQRGELLSRNAKAAMDEYLNKIAKFCFHTVPMVAQGGVIVMNCNPFTLGHQYLVEYAADKVDFLYVFVVQEDRSWFSFTDRYEMVRRGTGHLHNVLINPSGSYMISYKTLPVYFEKEIIQDKEVDMTQDIEVFARYIAPELGVTVRYVGEEPEDRITRQYNEQMKLILGEYDIELCEIPRKKLQGEYISATKVRKYLKNGDWSNASRLIPEVNWDICKKYLQENKSEG